MHLELWALIISIISGCIAIASFIQAMLVRQWTRQETQEQMSFLTHLIVNSASDPDTVRRMLEDYSRVGIWRAKVSRRPDGKYGLDFAIQIGGEVTPKGELTKH